MSNLQGFDATQVAPMRDFTPIPAGDYKAAITSSETRATKAGTGSYLNLGVTVLDGEYKGRRVFANLNLDNPNSQAVEIAKSELSAICHAVGVLTPNDSAELHDRPFVATIGLEKRNDNGEMQNRIKKYISLKKHQGTTGTDAVSAGRGSSLGDEAPW